MDIDAVITWVDGDDPVLRAKRNSYASPEMLSRSDIAGVTRYRAVGEIFWCVASINRFAPWIHKIYIVTDGQDPHLEPFLQRAFPGGYIPIEIVDHKVIFQGYEQYLPTFNSLTLETMTWRIPGLSEHFIEFNDDLALVSPITPEDVFPTEDTQVCHASWRSIPFLKFMLGLKALCGRTHKVTVKESLLNSMMMLGGHPLRMLRPNHTPKMLLKSVYREYFEAHPEAIERNCTPKFCTTDQFLPQEVQFELQRRAGKLKRLPLQGYLLYMEPKNKPHYIERKIAKLRSGSYRYCCFNEMDGASQEDLQLVVGYISELLGIDFSQEC